MASLSSARLPLARLRLARLRLARDVAIRVGVDDRTEFGSPLSARPQEGVRALFRPVLDHVAANGFDRLLAIAPELLDSVVGGSAFRGVATRVGDGGWSVRPEVLYPDAEHAHVQDLAFVGPTGDRVQVAVPRPTWPLVHELIAALAVGGCSDPDELHPHMRQLLDTLRERGLVVPGDAMDAGEAGGPGGPGGPVVGSDLTFMGHNAVVVRSGRAAVIVDPFLSAAGPAYPATYQPLGLRDVGRLDAVVITHSHPDHFDPASLLQFPPDVRVVVPVVERETILAVDTERRLRELGFVDVQPLVWGESTMVGDIEISAVPFYGEQPTDGDVLHPEIRNAGNAYVVATPAFSAAFVADSGRDHLGDVKDVATAWCRDRGPVDIVFSGYRGWDTFPVQLLFSSVAAFLLFVPRHSWGARQRLMNSAVDAVDLGERWGARYVVPYADGGAPWHWETGLGPRLDGSGIEDVDFDPYPERVIAAARNRIQVPGGRRLASPVEVVLLRPGDSLADVAGEPRVVRVPGHVWPYGEPVLPPEPATVGR